MTLRKPLSYLFACLAVLEQVKPSLDTVATRHDRRWQHTGSFLWKEIPAFPSSRSPYRWVHAEYAGNTGHLAFGQLEQGNGGPVVFISRTQRNLYFFLHGEEIWIRPYRSALTMNRHTESEFPIGAFTFPEPTRALLGLAPEPEET